MKQEKSKTLQEMMAEHFPGWQLREEIGRGTFSEVYRIAREGGDGKEEQAALKWIQYRAEAQEQTNLKSRASDTDIREYREHTRLLIEQEIRITQELKDCPYVVPTEEYAVSEREDGGLDLLIRMKLLTPLTAAFRQMTTEDAVAMAGDICRALKACREAQVIHRDVKPANIYRDDEGRYRLGDFGVAGRMIGETAKTKRGSPLYMAPEVYREQNYDYRADLYSLGLVLFELLNEQRPPFVPLRNGVPDAEEEQASIDARMTGKDLPSPSQARGGVTEVLRTACAFDPEDRYDSPEEFLAALEKTDPGKEPLKGTRETPGSEQDQRTMRGLPRNTMGMSQHPIASADDETEDGPDEPPEKPGKPNIPGYVDKIGEYLVDVDTRKKKRRKWLIAGAVAAAAAAAVLLLVLVILPSGRQYAGLQYRQNGMEATVTWQKGGGGPWTVQILQGDTVLQEQQVKERQATFSLMPGRTYLARVEDQKLEVVLAELPESGAKEPEPVRTFIQYYQIQAGGEKKTLTETEQIVYTEDLGTEGGPGYRMDLWYRTQTEVPAVCWLSWGDRIEKQEISFAPVAGSTPGVVAADLTSILLQGGKNGGTALKYSIYIDNERWMEGEWNVR